MAEVWKARHTQFEAFAAIKFLLPNLSGDAEIQERFLTEGRSQFILRHPNIVRSSDFITQDNRHFLVMDYIEGRSLYTLAMDEGPLAASRVVQLSLPLLDALGYAHEKGIVHRDVKLQNILLDERDKPYLTDFGIAKALRALAGTSAGRRHTSAGTILGSMECMSPEQIQHPADIDGRSDIYSFGCVLYDLLTGQPPFVSDEETESEFEIQRRHVFEPPRPLRELNPAVPEAIEAVVLRALEKDRNKRFTTCRDMARALQGESVPLDSSPNDSQKPATAENIVGEGEARRRGYTPTRIQKVEPAPVQPEPAQVAPPSTPQRQWFSAVVATLLVVALGFAGYKAIDSYRAPKDSQAEQKPVPVPVPVDPNPPVHVDPVSNTPDPAPLVHKDPAPPPVGGETKPPIHSDPVPVVQSDPAPAVPSAAIQAADFKLSIQQKQVTKLDQDRQDFELKVRGLIDEVGRHIQSIEALTTYFRNIESEALLVEKEINAATSKRDSLAAQVAKAQQRRDDELMRYSQSDKQAETLQKNVKAVQQNLEQLVKTLRDANDNAGTDLASTSALDQEFKNAGPGLSTHERKTAELTETITRSRTAYTDQQKRAMGLIQRINATIQNLEGQKDATLRQLNRTGAAIEHAKSLGEPNQ